MKSLRDVIKNLRRQYALERSDDPDSVIKAFIHVFIDRFDGSRLEEFISEIAFKRNKIIMYVTHPVVIQEIDSYKERLIKAVNDDLGTSIVNDIRFEVVPE